MDLDNEPRVQMEPPWGQHPLGRALGHWPHCSLCPPVDIAQQRPEFEQWASKWQNLHEIYVGCSSGNAYNNVRKLLVCRTGFPLHLGKVSPKPDGVQWWFPGSRAQTCRFPAPRRGAGAGARQDEPVPEPGAPPWEEVAGGRVLPGAGRGCPVSRQPL